MLRRGLNGFAEAYMAGDIDTNDLARLFAYYLDSEPALPGVSRFLGGASWRDRFFHRSRANTRAGSRRNIRAHYDLGNSFYRLWLDDGMTYSSGIYRSDADTLEQAQAEKYARTLSALELAPHHRILEIGCGWGGFAEAAAAHVRHVTGITISDQQHEEATARMARHGLSDRVEIRLQDYRDATGTFERIASIEMIEAVGEEHWPTYFRAVADRLAPAGVGVVQAITIRPDLYESYCRNPDFIQRYIFPGGMLPTVAAMSEEAHRAGLTFETVETFGLSYALTLEEWRRRFLQSWPRIAALGFDDRFRRMWDYYLCYCAVGFRRGMIDVGLYRVRKSACPPRGIRKPFACVKLGIRQNEAGSDGTGRKSGRHRTNAV
jgi:cyclopropane-fatty-acyl-phospholipid synthase